MDPGSLSTFLILRDTAFYDIVNICHTVIGGFTPNFMKC